jgi:Rrf2 family protein
MLSTTAKYALEALVYLAANRDRQPVLAREISQHAGIPHNYLSKLLHGLRKAGYLEAVRGKNGGYRLQRPPGQIRLAEIVQLFDDIDAYRECFIHVAPCNRRKPCALHRRWAPIADSIIQLLEKTTLEEAAA